MVSNHMAQCDNRKVIHQQLMIIIAVLAEGRMADVLSVWLNDSVG